MRAARPTGGPTWIGVPGKGGEGTSCTHGEEKRSLGGEGPKHLEVLLME